MLRARWRTRKWQDKEGQDRYTTEIVGNEMQMLDSRGMSDGQTGLGGQSYQSGAAAQSQQAAPQGSKLKPQWHPPVVMTGMMIFRFNPRSLAAQ